MQRAVIDMKTGEVLNRPNDSVRIIRKESMDAFESKADWRGEQFFKGYTNELRKVLPTLSQSEKALLFSIAPYVSYFDCHLQWSNGKDITLDGIVRISGYSRKTTIKVLNDLLKKDIIYRGKNSENNQWFVNPWLFSRGSTINKVLKTMFQNYHIRTKGCRWKDLGDF
jgi:hypothetical protein